MNDPTLRDRLLAAEPLSPDLERRFRERLKEITERPLTAADRVGLVIGALAALATIVWFVHLLSPYPAGHPRLGLLALRIGIVLAAAFGLYAVLVLRRGTEDLRRDGGMLTQLVLGSTLVMVGLLMWQGRLLPDPARGNQKMLIALAVWTLAGLPYCVSMFVRRSEIKLRTDLLRLELALAELGEQQGRRPE
jgi:hypothetical protein